MKQVQWGIPSAIFSLLVAVTSALAVAEFTSRFLALPTAETLLWSLLAQAFGLLVVPLTISYLKGNGPRSDFNLHFRRADLRLGFIYGLLMIFIALLIATFQMMLFGEFTSAAAMASQVFLENFRLLIIFILLVGLVGPFVEEVAFRGMWYRALLRKFNSKVIAIAGSAFVFSLIHLEIERIFLIFITGLILGYLRAKTNSLGAPIVAHMVNNTPGALGFLFLATGPVPI
ncbi:MAG: CPBP family intramembrane glutamic endopeptidase [Candidatus Nanopelagicales bacterium]